MRSKRNLWLGAVAVVSAMLTATTAVAQDYPTLSANPQRTGVNGAPAASGPGRAQLLWFAPNALDNVGGTVLRNNTAIAPNVTFAGSWIAPPLTDLAGFVYDGPPTGSRDGDEATGAATTYAPDALHPYTYDGRAPAYLYSNTIPGSQADPTVKQNAADTLSTFTWQINPALAPNSEVGGNPHNYALYVWIPIGSTGPAPGLFPQRFFVYDIIYGNGLRWIEVVDTYLSGPGWIRLGAGGLPTNKLFFYNGTNPIQVRLFNTVPYNRNGTLSDTPYTTAVYADGVKAVPEIGSYTATPTVSRFTTGLGTQTRTVAALNQKTIASRDNSGQTLEQGVVTSRVHDTGALVWAFNVADFSPYSRSVDDNSAGVTQNPAPPAVGSWTSQVTPGVFLGTDYLTNDIQNVSAASASIVTYAPPLEDGDYDIQIYLGGDVAGETYGRFVNYEIHEGPTVTTVLVDQSRGPGWFKLGTRRYVNDTATAPLSVVVTNYSADAGDVTRKAYTDAIRFVGAVNLTVTSTPIQATALVRPPGGGPAVDTPVVIIPAEDGRIYCVEAQGNGNGTTNVLWAYPSIRDINDPAWTDPNQVVGQDGPGGIAEMPVTGFGKSSGFVQRIGGVDYLFIAAENGRIYCIDMAGRGDANFTTGKAGTTTRVWTYPDDYPRSPVKPSSLGDFVGSLSYAVTAAGPTIFAPATQGRLYAIDAVGTPATKTTSVRWTFPARNQPNVGEILTSPTVAFGKVYFGTAQKDDELGEFYALNADTGAQVWKFTGSASAGASAFESTPAAVSALELGGGMPDTIFVANDNLFVYALDAATGALIWETNELNAAPIAPLTYTPMTVFNNAGTMEVDPIIMVPTLDGKFAGLFARQAGVGSTNRFGTKRAYQYNAAAGLAAGVAVGRNWMYGADLAGNLYAFNDNPGNLPPITPGDPPGDEEIVENDPKGDLYREAKMRYITKAQYQGLRQDNTDPTTPGYSAVVGSPEPTVGAFEWGQTVYMLVYDFPYDKTDANGNPVTEPVVNFTISTDGAVTRQFAIVSRQWKSGSGYPNSSVDSSVPLDGYAILAFPIQGSGPNALPPGGGQVSFSLTTASLGTNSQPQQIAPNPTLSRRNFQVANPLGLAMRMTGPGTPDPLRSIGYTTDPNDPQNLIDGTRDVNSAAFPGNNESLLGVSAGVTQHNGSGTATIMVVDRSLMTLLRGPGRGLDNIRVSRNRLAWQGGIAAVVNPLPPAIFPNMEDLPVNFPNDSIDYPDVALDQIRVVKDPSGTAENPVFNAATLFAPINVDENAPLSRTLVPTPFEFTVDAPRFQPANLSSIQDSASTAIDGGYAGRMQVFVDSDSSGTLSSLGGRREAFRSFTFASSVGIDKNLAVRTPLVDLGSLPSGAGYSPLAPGSSTGLFSPWAPPYGTAAADFYSMFKPFVIDNPGNVNLLNVRLAKNTRLGSTTSAWPIFADANDIYAWLDANANVFTDFDSNFGLMGAYSILQKPRVGDRVATQFAPNPPVRENANLGVLAGYWDPSKPTDPGENVPRIAVTLPFGFPQGVYSSILRVIEDENGDESLQINGGGSALEPFSDPTFTVRWNTREVRLTSAFTKTDAPQIDDPSVVTPSNFQWANTQPAAVRAANGSIVLAYASTRTSFTAPQPTGASVNDQYRIYIGSVGTGVSSVATNPLRDLNFMAPVSNSQWFRQSPATVNGYPSGPLPPLFLTQPGETVIPESVRFGAPNFPTLGFADPYSPNTTFGQTFMVFIGEAQKTTSGGRISESRLFVAPVSVDGSGNVTIGTAVPMQYEAQIPKGRPSIVQVSANRAVIFYSSAGTGQSQVFYTVYDSATGFSAPKELGVGDGFESATGPSAVARLYTGANVAGVGSDHVIEISFTGKLRGRQNSEVFFARMTTDGAGNPNGLTFLPVRSFETLTPERETGVYRAGGVQWNRRGTIQIQQTLNGVTTNLDGGNRQIDRTTGLITIDTTLGGRAYIDPNMGTVRFASATPNRSAVIQLTYQARILRASANTAAGFVGTSLLFDNRIVGDTGYWARVDGTAVQANDTPRSARMVFTYNRAAAGGGQTARPFIRTMRFGIQLPHAIYTAPDGSLSLPGGGLSIAITGNADYYQIDPANGRVYFEGTDEDRDVVVNYYGIDPTTGAPVDFTGLPVAQKTYRVGLVSERTEQPLPIEQAINETALTTLLDPADNPNWRRPGLIWMFWSSTRTGGSDIYFQTIAPRFTPVTGK